MVDKVAESALVITEITSETAEFFKWGTGSGRGHWLSHRIFAIMRMGEYIVLTAKSGNYIGFIDEVTVDRSDKSGSSKNNNQTFYGNLSYGAH